MPTTRIGCRRCCWKSRSFSTAANNPFYQHGDATQFIAVRGEETVGRVLVSDDPLYNQEHGANVGCFGMFECVDDREGRPMPCWTAAADWLRGRGRTVIRGPIDYSINYQCGLLIEGFRHAAADHDEPQPPLLRRPAGVVGACKRGKTSMRGGSSMTMI